MENAERWKHSSPIFKQTDFPTPADEVEMFAIPMNYNTDAGNWRLTLHPWIS